MHGMQNWNTWCVSEPSGSSVVIVAAALKLKWWGDRKGEEVGR